MSVLKEQEFTKQFDMQLWKRLLAYAKPYKKHLMLLALIMMAVAGVDVIFPLMTKYAIDHFVVPGTIEGISRFIGGYVLLVILQTFNVWQLIAVAGKIEMGVCYDIRKIGFQKLQELSFSYYDKTAVGWIMARMTSDIQRLSEIISWGLVDLVWGGTLMTAIMGVLFFLNWKLALITLVVAPFLVIISLFFQRKILASYRQVRKVNSRITGAFNEGIMGAKTSKTLVREEENLKDFQILTNEMYASSVRAAIFSAVFLPVVLTLGSVGTGLAIWFGGRGVLLKTISYGTLVAFISYTIQFFEPVRELARIIAELQAAQASAERVLSMIDSEPEIIDEERVVKAYGDLFHPKKENWPEIEGNICFQNVSFTYKEGEKVLENFSLEVKAGENIALVGETGSGKSTIVNLLCRFYEPTEGQILIDGTDYRERSQLWLQSNLGYVLQTPHLFSGTIRENIQYGRLDATEEEIVQAAKLVNAHEFIIRMENSYNTQVGEGGNRLSTGEKQLISFARAILANPKIFVLDEATSSIDTETEQMIQQAIEKVLRGRTSFIIAHRLSTIRSAHRILVIREGKILESGTHGQLIKKKGYYYDLYTNQFKEEKEIQMMKAQ
ncbi:ABC transporter ATP-binding protein [Geosporobacter ferrireducens]|uniref:ABC transporter ATP-binding protein n=1 Tax=Geosporobacter ferrireducens TaxID=1424294 RepID=A0A1D8GDS0_9FIRM|nr:ABC transporter ATP-binding protein [Geosporobacter ferrireducens]AOT69063.1 ABC transporter ATP-binding protein [Geosporobacter ferrireducens]MTI56734.1 ABC transporter ATP-binding protein [Geosporobacter ferrireducens]